MVQYGHPWSMDLFIHHSHRTLNTSTTDQTREQHPYTTSHHLNNNNNNKNQNKNHNLNKMTWDLHEGVAFNQPVLLRSSISAPTTPDRKESVEWHSKFTSTRNLFVGNKPAYHAICISLCLVQSHLVYDQVITPVTSCLVQFLFYFPFYSINQMSFWSSTLSRSTRSTIIHGRLATPSRAAEGMRPSRRAHRSEEVRAPHLETTGTAQTRWASDPGHNPPQHWGPWGGIAEKHGFIMGHSS